MPSARSGVVADGRLDLHLNLNTKLETINQTGVPDEHTRRPSLAGYDSEGGPNRFSRYEADFRPMNTHVDPEPWTHRDQDQYSRPPSNMGGGNDGYYHEETSLPERNRMGGYPRNRGLGLTSSRVEKQREIQDVSRFVYNWKISFSGKSGVSAEDFLTRLEECRGFTPINDDDLLRALPLILQDVELKIQRKRWTII